MFQIFLYSLDGGGWWASVGDKLKKKKLDVVGKKRDDVGHYDTFMEDDDNSGSRLRKRLLVGIIVLM